MPYSILSPANSFVQFGESGLVTSCNFRDILLCLPVYEENDVYFQFIVQSTTEEEADALCDLDNASVSVGLAADCESSLFKTFAEKPDRFRISGTQVLYNWSHGFPGFTDYVNIGDCFVIKVTILEETDACSNCFNRIGNDCHTSVLEYGNDDNAFGFNYCNSEGSEVDQSQDCDPTFITFTNQSTLIIPYTAAMVAKYGNVPTIKTWIHDGTGELTNMIVSQKLNTYPPTQIEFDFGGVSTGVIKIS